MTVIKDIQVVSQGYSLAIRHREGVTLWPLRQKLPGLQVRKGTTGITQFLLSQNKRNLIYCNEYNQLVKANLADQTQNAHIAMENLDVFDIALFGNGDALLLSKVDLDFGSHSSENSSSKDSKRCLHGITILDVDQAYKVHRSSKSESVQSTPEWFKKCSNKTLILKMLPRFQELESKGYYSLLQSSERVTSCNLICNKGLAFPLVFENDRSVVHLPFYTENQATSGWRGTLLAGTEGGTCYSIDFSLDAKGKFSTSLNITFQRGKPVVAKAQKPEPDQGFGFAVSSQETLGDIFNPQKSLKSQAVIHDYKRFLAELVEVAIVQKKSRLQKSKFTVFAKRVGQNFWSSMQFQVKTMNSFSGQNYFRVHRMGKCPKLSGACFYFVNNIGIGLLHFDQTAQTLRIRRFFDMQISQPWLVCYSKSTNLFLVPANNTLEIWDQSLSVFVQKLQFKSEVLSVYLCTENLAPRLLVYEQALYQEIDLQTFCILRQCALALPKSEKPKHGYFYKHERQSGLVIPLNLGSISSNRAHKFPLFRRGVSTIDFISCGECFDLFHFPFTSIEGCFSSHNYKKSIRMFAKHYFTTIKQFDNADPLYGPLNPLTLAVHQGDMALLEDLLARYCYPKAVMGYFSPLGFAFKLESFSAVHIIVEHLLDKNYSVNFSRKDFRYLLDSDLEDCHALLARVPLPINERSFPTFLRLNKNTHLFQANSLIEVLVKIKKKETRKAVQSKRRGCTRLSEKLRPRKQVEVESFKIPFEYCYTPGTFESLQLLEKIAHSQSSEFALSLWSEVVEAKWDRFYFSLLIKGVAFFILMCLVTPLLFISSLKSPKLFNAINDPFQVIFGIFGLFSVFEVISFCFFGIKK